MGEADIRIETLSRPTMIAYVAELRKIAADQPDEYWEQEHFLHDLPQKWELSFAVFSRDKLAGYAILSRKDDSSVHLHHFMLGPDSRGLGIGGRMMEEVERRARDAGAATLSLKFRTGNIRVQRFYERCGLQLSGPEAGYRMMTKKLTRRSGDLAT